MAISITTAYKTTDGKVFLTEKEALAAELDYELHSAVNVLVDRIKPFYGDADVIAAVLLDEPALIARIAELQRKR